MLSQVVQRDFDALRAAGAMRPKALGTRPVDSATQTAEPGAMPTRARYAAGFAVAAITTSPSAGTPEAFQAASGPRGWVAQ